MSNRITILVCKLCRQQFSYSMETPWRPCTEVFVSGIVSEVLYSSLLRCFWHHLYKRIAWWSMHWVFLLTFGITILCQKILYFGSFWAFHLVCCCRSEISNVPWSPRPPWHHLKVAKAFIDTILAQNSFSSLTPEILRMREEYSPPRKTIFYLYKNHQGNEKECSVWIPTWLWDSLIITLGSTWGERGA